MPTNANVVWEEKIKSPQPCVVCNHHTKTNVSNSSPAVLHVEYCSRCCAFWHSFLCMTCGAEAKFTVKAWKLSNMRSMQKAADWTQSSQHGMQCSGDQGKGARKPQQEACLSAQVHNEVTPPMQGHVFNGCQLGQTAVIVWAWQLG